MIRVRNNLQGQGFSFENPNAPPAVQSLSVQDLKAQLEGSSGHRLRVFDVRGPDERDRASLPVARALDEDGRRTLEQLPGTHL